MIKGLLHKDAAALFSYEDKSFLQNKRLLQYQTATAFLYMCFIFVFSYTEILAVRLSQADFPQLRQGSSEKFQWWFQCR